VTVTIYIPLTSLMVLIKKIQLNKIDKY